VLKSEVISGSPTKVVTLEVFQQRYEYVSSVTIDLNALNGVSTANDTVSGEDLAPVREKGFALKEI
jgi:hypothetical protein